MKDSQITNYRKDLTSKFRNKLALQRLVDKVFGQ